MLISIQEVPLQEPVLGKAPRIASAFSHTSTRCSFFFQRTLDPREHPLAAFKLIPTKHQKQSRVSF